MSFPYNPSSLSTVNSQPLNIKESLHPNQRRMGTKLPLIFWTPDLSKCKLLSQYFPDEECVKCFTSTNIKSRYLA